MITLTIKPKPGGAKYSNGTDVKAVQHFTELFKLFTFLSSLDLNSVEELTIKPKQDE